MEQQLIQRIVEAALLASGNPLSLAQLQALFGEETPPPTDSIERALQALAEHNAERGVQLIEVASGFRYQVSHDVHDWVARLWAERPAKYSRALLETLALIAYRQPITRGEIEQIRGVAVSTGIVKTLEEREWIRVVGHRDVPGRPALFGTTRGFLDYFGLRSLDQLPSLSELQDLPELEPQLQLEPVALDLVGASAAAQLGWAEADDASASEADPLQADEHASGSTPAAESTIESTTPESDPSGAEAADVNPEMPEPAASEHKS